MKLLIIEDEPALRESIEKYFSEAGVLCESCDTLDGAISKISLYDYDCILLDIGLPDGEGFTVLEHLKAHGKNEGVLIISARNSLDTKIKGLNLGADDYLIKPFHLAELKARIDAIYRRRAFNTNNLLVHDLINIDLSAREVKVNSVSLIFTRKEYDMLLYFIANKGKVISKNAIAEHLWGDEFDLADSFDFIYTHIKNIRKKLMEAARKDYIKAIYGVGYKFV
ncbi:response regulator transcription factor [Mucilaginibacter ximonensis]|uniref:Response regulator transcription factor n=1 Tax=Mucilaginibacter ximonensis TaxID=538021 RepID=A0ABW5YF71_9SPHI